MTPLRRIQLLTCDILLWRGNFKKSSDEKYVHMILEYQSDQHENTVSLFVFSIIVPTSYQVYPHTYVHT